MRFDAISQDGAQIAPNLRIGLFDSIFIGYETDDGISAAGNFIDIFGDFRVGEKYLDANGALGVRYTEYKKDGTTRYFDLSDIN